MAASPIWFKTSTENLIRHRSGTYYLNAKVAKQKHRYSLETTVLKVAKIKRDEELEKLRAKAVRKPSGIHTVGDALAAAEERSKKPNLKESTREYYGFVAAGLRKVLPVDLPAKEWTFEVAADWWDDYSDDFSASYANNALRLVKDLTTILRAAGIIEGEEWEKDLKRLKGEERLPKDLPSVKELKVIVGEIRKVGRSYSEQAADMVEFLAWSGMRVGEGREVTWEDVGEDWIVVTGGKNLTKNWKPRRVPISKPLRALLGRRRGKDAAGRIFMMKTPRLALQNACERLKRPKMRVHDLRHFFATHAIEKGVDIPTVAKWLGHQDGGKLLLNTYGHLRDEHSLAAARKLG